MKRITLVLLCLVLLLTAGCAKQESAATTEATTQPTTAPTETTAPPRSRCPRRRRQLFWQIMFPRFCRFSPAGMPWM